MLYKRLRPLLALAAGCCVLAPLVSAQGKPQGRASGIAWRVQGDWQQAPYGALLKSGDPISPGALLRTLKPETTHSITLLLPDGQRILYECFTEEDCVRGFRIPLLLEVPTPFVTRMMEQISAALVEDRTQSNTHGTVGARDPSPAAPARTTVAKRDEDLVPLQTDNLVKVSGLLSKLPDGDYSYNLEPLDRSVPARLHSVLHKTSAVCILPVPAAGLYKVDIWDKENTPRIQLFLAVVDASQAKAFSAFAKARKTLNDWDKDFYGWPVHELLPAYLESLTTSAMPRAVNERPAAK